MKQEETKARLFDVTAVASAYCSIIRNAAEYDKTEFVNSVLSVLPKIYWEFFDISTDGIDEIDELNLQEYIDEDYYENIRRHIEILLGADDTYLETFEEDMKYSDTPISASVAEGLADIFQALFNFTEDVRESEGEQMSHAFALCKENFETYWGQTLCNVMRALNSIRFSANFGEE